ncbi:MAG: hypothetical protein Q7I96_00625 [Methanobacteriaceae archaeon]|nr:hypothetical protein [Methanobacteriaceae archaeon]
MTRDRIYITPHGSIRIRGRQNFTDDEIKDCIIEKFPNKFHKNEYGEFELTYSHLNRKSEEIIIIVVPHNSSEKSIRIITTYSH